MATAETSALLDEFWRYYDEHAPKAPTDGIPARPVPAWARAQITDILNAPSKRSLHVSPPSRYGHSLYARLLVDFLRAHGWTDAPDVRHDCRPAGCYVLQPPKDVDGE